MKQILYVLIILFSVTAFVSPIFANSIQKKQEQAKKHIKNNQIKALQRMLKKNVLKQKNAQGETLLFYAIETGNIKAVKLLIRKGAKLNDRAKVKYGFLFENGKIKNMIRINPIHATYGDTPLIMAIKSRNKAMIELLIKKGAKVNTAIPSSNIPLHAAVDTGDISMVKLLMKHGVKLNDSKSKWVNPLVLAIKNDDLKMLKFLVNEGVSIQKTEALSGSLIVSAMMLFKENKRFTKKRLEVVKYLFSKKAKVDSRVLYMAIKNDSVPLIKYILRQDIEAKDTETYNVFELASSRGNLGILKALLKAKSNEKILNKSLASVMQSMLLKQRKLTKQAQNKKEKEKMVQFLIKEGANVHYVDPKTGKNILILAIENNMLWLVKQVVAKGGQVNFVSKHGYTPLMAASKNLPMMKLLVKHGANINLYNPKYPQNLLSYAIAMGNNSNNDVLFYLINKKANKKHAFYHAAIAFNVDVLKVLLKKKVHINKKYKGDTPLDGAIKYAANKKKSLHRNPQIKETLRFLVEHKVKYNPSTLQLETVKAHKKLYSFLNQLLKTN